jgi:uncharacterized iron-regulated protein
MNGLGMRRRNLLAVVPFLVITACAQAVARPTTPRPAESRIYDVKAARYIDIAALVDALASADVVFFGEQHDDPATHRAELAYLAGVGARTGAVVLSLEMFERDVQHTLDDYLANVITDSSFQAASRPWPRYTSDYRPLVEYARARGFAVVAANVPRRIASVVSHAGLAALDTIPASDRALVARDIACPHDAYYDRFAEEMTGHSAGAAAPASNDAAAIATTNRFYEAQCIKDETMAESIVAAHARAATGTTVMHFNGAFHSDLRLGTAMRVLRRDPRLKILVISAVPVDDVARADAVAYSTNADYIVLTPRPPK